MDTPGGGTFRYTDTPTFHSWAGIESDKSDPVSTDTTPPTIDLATAPGDYSSSGTTYDGESAWTGTIGGTAADNVGGSGLASVAVSIQQVGGSCWTGSSSTFSASCPNFVPATGLGSWSLSFPAGNFPHGGAYTITARATDGASNATTTSALTVNVDYDPAHTTF